MKIRIDDATPAVAATKVQILNPPAKPLKLDAALPLSVSTTPLNATAQDVVWTSSDPKIVSVNSQGIVLARAEGTATITAKLGEKLTATCPLKVEKAGKAEKPGKAKTAP